jgi:hypothetical protein
MNTRWMVAGALLASLAFVACGDDDDDDSGGFRSGAGDFAANESQGGKLAAAAAPGAPSTGAYDTDVSGGVGDEPFSAADISRKIIFTANLSLNSGDVGRSFNDASSLARSNGGYVERSQYSNNPEDNSKRSASLTIRVPVQNYDALVASLRTMAGVTVDTEGSNSNEVTEQYTDLVSRLRNLERTEQQYLKLLTEAKSIQDILTVQDRLSGVRSQIEQIQGRLKVLDDLTDFATINLVVAPVVTKAAEGSSGWSFSEVFVTSLEGSLVVAQVVAAGIIVLFVAGIWLVIPVGLGLYANRKFRHRTLPETN